MNGKYVNIFLLGIIVFLLLMNFVQGWFSTNPAFAQKESEQIGRYQISAWASQISTGYHHSGYYIVDTVTGKIVDSKSEAHSSKQ